MKGIDGITCVVTGGSGFVGRRLVEMLIEAGAGCVRSFDLNGVDDAPFLEFLCDEESKGRVVRIKGDLTKYEEVVEAFRGADAVWHVAALVGPYFRKEDYFKVNYQGTLNVINACKELGIRKLVASSSPSTRFHGSDISGLREEDLRICAPGEFLEPYAETKAMGEIAVREANSNELMTVAIAPHQVYGPRDSLFLPNILMACKSGKMRVIGSGKNMVSFTHVDNYCHGLLCGFQKLYRGSPVLGKFYIVSDGKPANFWEAVDEASVGIGGGSIMEKFRAPYFLVMAVAFILQLISKIMNIHFRLTPFTVTMITIDRWFDISNAMRDLEYEPLINFREGWKSTYSWFNAHQDWWQSKVKGTMHK